MGVYFGLALGLDLKAWVCVIVFMLMVRGRWLTYAFFPNDMLILGTHALVIHFFRKQHQYQVEPNYLEDSCPHFFPGNYRAAF